jgi:hypothetical protein
MGTQQSTPEDRREDQPQTCFVVMPFGTKPIRDGTEASYDFDKVYRVIIKRAIRQAGLLPLRADERVGSAIIYAEMFKDLRDQPVVLADLSLDNANVFYELGIRHVLSNAGTVLMCRKGSILPFDVHLSRVVFYQYDGQSLDWEEVEKVVTELQAALQAAKRREPDSPVHALLETVLRSESTAGAEGAHSAEREDETLIPFQRLVARSWTNEGQTVAELLREQRNSIFGLRSLGYLVHDEGSLPKETAEVAAALADGEQYRLANLLFEQLLAAKRLEPIDLLRFATSYSEAHPSVPGVDRALELAQEALALIRQRHGEAEPEDPAHVEGLAHYWRRVAGLQHWRWQLTGRGADLETSIASFGAALEGMRKARVLGGFPHPGLVAQAHLKAMLLLRVREGTRERADVEGHRDAIGDLKPEAGDDPVGVSYLSWFQTIALADAGATDASRRKALTTLVDDGRLMGDYLEVGRRQYTMLRRFLEQNSRVLRNPTLIGAVSQILQAGSRRQVQL